MTEPDELLPLEDTRKDVIAKALSHMAINRKELPKTPEEWPNFLSSRLHLDPQAFLTMPDAIPPIPLPDGLERHILPFGEWTLNIWTLPVNGGLVVIDTGLSPDQLIAATRGHTPAAILITHFHRDHTGGTDAYSQVPVHDPANTRPDPQPRQIAGLEWTVLDLAGHTPDGIGWFTIYQGTPLFFPGDSIFACSIGKYRGNEQQTMHNILAAMRSLPPETIICPGHGPATTIALEWQRNPFIAPFRHT